MPCARRRVSERASASGRCGSPGKAPGAGTSAESWVQSGGASGGRLAKRGGSMRAVIVAFVLTLFGTPFAIRAFTRLRAAQPIRDINTSHAGKRGTPTMGGVVFIVGTVVAYLARHLILNTLPEQQIVPPGPTITGLVLLGLMVFSGAIGFIDDYLKVRKRNSLGLNKRGKLLLQLVVGAAFGIVALYFPATNGQTVGSTHISFVKDIGWLGVGKIGAVILFLAVVMATT